MNRRPILDASAVLCFLRDEPGATAVAPLLDGGILSAVNLAEVITKLAEHDTGRIWVDQLMASLMPRINVIPFDADLAWRAGLLRATTRHLGLSLGDRACLALAAREGGIAVTCDRAWGQVAGIAVELVR